MNIGEYNEEMPSRGWLMQFTIELEQEDGGFNRGTKLAPRPRISHSWRIDSAGVTRAARFAGR